MGIPSNNYSIKINFPNGTNINKNDFKMSTKTNGVEIERNNISVKSNENSIEMLDNTLIYPGTDVIIEYSFSSGKISKINVIDKFEKFFKYNLISAVVLILSIIVFGFEICNLKNRTSKKAMIKS